ncbi:hypothetical protein FRC16_011054 [Serendipita sp. 398]|nr:hypothetical protein FRC16_011054 [Serendipita sp. 398]
MAATASLVASVAVPPRSSTPSLEPQSNSETRLVKRVPIRPGDQGLSPQQIREQHDHHTNLAHHWDTVKVDQAGIRDQLNEHARNTHQAATDAFDKGHHLEAANLRGAAARYETQAQAAGVEATHAEKMADFHGQAMIAYGHASRGDRRTAHQTWQTAVGKLPDHLQQSYAK